MIPVHTKHQPHTNNQTGLRTVTVRRAFEGVRAIDGVSLHLARHEVLGLIGPNGAGKTTLINVITGFDLPTAGSVQLDGHDITRWSAAQRGRAGLGRTFQHGHLFGALSVRENIEVAALGVGARRREARARATELLDALELAPDQPASVLPHGDRRKLGVGRALATRPRYVLMDEPAAGLMEAELPTFVTLIRRVRDEYETGVLLVDHNMPLVMQVCDRIHVLDLGQTIAEGTPEEVRRDARVAEAYLGGRFAGTEPAKPSAPAPGQAQAHGQQTQSTGPAPIGGSDAADGEEPGGGPDAGPRQDHG